MYINKQRNKFVTEKYSQIATDFFDLFGQDSYIGDDMLVNNCNAYFLKDEHFIDQFNQVAIAPIYKQMAWRMHILDFFFSHSLQAKGSYVECGVFRGFKSFFLLKKYQDQMMNRASFLFDTFEGIDRTFLMEVLSQR